MSTAQNKYVVPNPLSSIASHHYAAKGLCQVFLIRQQLLYAADYVLSNSFDSLVQYLRSPTGRNVDHMPVWWCPWIHDIGLLLSLVRYGFLAFDKLLQDEELPFHARYLESHVRQVFLLGTQHLEPAVGDELRTEAEADVFMQCAMMQFPDPKDLEYRLMRILYFVTAGTDGSMSVKRVPFDHYCRVQSYRLLRAAPFAPGVVNTGGKSHGKASSNAHHTENPLAAGSTSPTGTAVDSDNNDADAAPQQTDAHGTAEELNYAAPTVPLSYFLRESAKRRRLAVERQHTLWD